MSSRTTVFDHLAAILHPIPHFAPPADEAEHDGQDAVIDAVLDAREQVATNLEAGYDAIDADPVLSALAAARGRREAADADIRAILAYAREFTKPQPYQLKDLAKASGMSVSGIRTAYDAGTMTFVAGAILSAGRTDLNRTDS